MSSLALQLAVFGVFLSLIGGQEMELRPLQELHTKPLGSAIVLTCQITGATEADIKWFDGKGNEITTRTGRLYIENESALILKMYITNITNEDAGKYSCQATIDGKEIKKDVTLQLFEEISFGDFPLVQNPKINEDALIVCLVKGAPAPSVSWRHDGRRLLEDSKYSVGNNSGLIIRNITEADNGVYVCRGEVEADGRYSERHITVKVHTPPKLTRTLENVEVVQDSPVSFVCEAEGLPQPTFEFLKDDSDVPLASTDSIDVNSTGGSLNFTSVKKSDDGTYTCKAVNRVGSDSTSANLKVLVKPSISEFADLVGNQGTEVDLICRAEGDPIPMLAVYRDGRREEYQLGTSEDKRFTISSGQPGQLQLTLHELKLEDAGKYFCSATNKAGSDEKTADITVQFKPSFVDNSSEIAYNWVGNAHNLTCEPSGQPVPSTDWIFSDSLLTNNDTFQIYNLEGRSILEVTVKEVDQSWIYGPYTCRAKNPLGEADKVIEMRRATTPDPPQNVKVVERLPTALVLEVEPPVEDGGVPVTGYSVKYSIRVQETTPVVDETVSSDGNQTGTPESTYTAAAPELKMVESTEKKIRIENLSANTTYLFKVRAKNAVGLGNSVETTAATIAFSEPGTVIINSKTSSSDPFEYTITWEKPNTGGRPVKQYEFRFRKVTFNKNTRTVEEIPGSDWIPVFARDAEQHHILSHTLKSLSPNSYYQLKMRAENEIGWSEPSAEFLFSTVEASAASSQPAGVGAGVVVGIVFVVFIVFLVVVDVSCYFINNCGVTSFLCVKVCKRTRSNEKTMEEGESSEIVKQPLPDDENVVSIPIMEAEKPKEPLPSDVKEQPEEKLNQVREEKDEELKESMKDEIPLENAKVLDSEEVAFAEKA